jgi:RyR domain
MSENHVLTRDQALIMCARAAHEMNRTYCIAMGDDSQKSWEDAPPWQRDSALDGVLGVIERGNTPAESHANWLAGKVASGWTYGETKDEVAKTHPCMVPYEDLSPVQRQKDKLFVTTVKTMYSTLSAVNNSGEVWPAPL